ncbi:Microtubule-associated tumor suppressor candidate 2 [Myotis brandtii]|uniref:Microtubule-associated tumor suppressor candidate 2 n=1 Tax=Myotis brandtii TaxID=109478 RepID=S7NBY8_MYOBR|nr:Microtubule-associated tumor suppressor candidate 2 [Myotis brandtii]
MSVPLAPKKSHYTQLQDNRKGVKNNNESLLSLGDTNANQIMVEGGPSRDESQTCDLTDEIGNANSHEPENRSHFHNEFHSLQGFGKGLQAGPSSLKDLKLSSTVRREINEEHTMQRGTALLQPAWSGQGTSLAGWRSVTGEASPNVLTPRGTEAPRHAPKDQLAKMLDDATLRRHTLDRASSPAAAGDQFMKECARSLTQPPPQPVPLDPPDAPDGMPKGGEGPQETVTSHSPGTACPPADITSEGKSVCHPKPSTSETKETTCLEPPMEGAHVPEVSNENTPRSAHSECALTSASKEVLSKPEAQLDQEKGEPKPELKFVQPWALQEFLSARAECLGCPKEDSVLLQERNLPGREAQQEAPTRAVSSLTPPQSSVLTLGGPRGRSVQDQSAVPLGEQGSFQTFPKPGPASLRAADNQLPGKISPIAAGKLHESSSSSPSPGDGHAAFIPHAPADSRPSAASEEKRVLSSGSRASAMDFTSDPSVGESKTGVPEPLDPQSSSSEARESKEVTTSVAENKNLLENAVKTESSTAKTDSPLSVPTPLHPETTVSVTPQPSASLQDLSMSVDAGSPSGSLSAAPPPTDSLQLLNTSPKVPDKNTCPSGIPKPISTHSEGTPSSQEALESHQVERTAERTEPKPIILPKPKHVRPKIITYIRRSPQALGQVDTSLVPVGLPYAPPTCNTPLPKEEKVAGRDLKPAASLYEKFKPDLQKPRVFSPGLMVSGIKPPGHHFSQISEKFLQEVTELPGKEEFCSPPYAHYEVPPTFYRSAMLLKPQLGLGAMSRLPSAKSRILIASQRSSASAVHPPGPMATAASLYNSDPAGLGRGGAVELDTAFHSPHFLLLPLDLHLCTLAVSRAADKAAPWNPGARRRGLQAKQRSSYEGEGGGRKQLQEQLWPETEDSVQSEEQRLKALATAKTVSRAKMEGGGQSEGDLKKASSSNAAKSCLPKSGLRPPGYSRLPAAKLAALGFVRSSSVTSVSSTQSLDSAQPEQSRLANCKWGGWAGGLHGSPAQTHLSLQIGAGESAYACNSVSFSLCNKLNIWVD